MDLIDADSLSIDTSKQYHRYIFYAITSIRQYDLTIFLYLFSLPNQYVQFTSPSFAKLPKFYDLVSIIHIV